jgi:hypothetical protein
LLLMLFYSTAVSRCILFQVNGHRRRLAGKRVVSFWVSGVFSAVNGCGEQCGVYCGEALGAWAA